MAQKTVSEVMVKLDAACSLSPKAETVGPVVKPLLSRRV